MSRPKKKRIVACNPDISYFKPRGIPVLELEEICMSIDEREAIRLADLLGMSYEEAGRQMGVSRATFGRIIHQARQVVADALINGKCINIEGGDYTLVDETRMFRCERCSHKWEEPCGVGRPECCPSCGDKNFYRISDRQSDAGSYRFPDK